jgi:rhodanese-related sulfurtransferase
MFSFNFLRKNIFSNFGNNIGNRFGNRSRFTGEYKVIKQEELNDFLKQDVCIIDVRTESEFKGMRVKNAINIPLNMLNRDILSIVPDKETKILVYCVTGERARVAIQKLNSLGYKNIYIWGNGGLNTLKFKELLDY